MVSGDPEILADFQAAFGFPRPGRNLVPAVNGVELRLGNQAVRLIRAQPDGRFHPANIVGRADRLDCTFLRRARLE
jgi:hypothetical protein